MKVLERGKGFEDTMWEGRCTYCDSLVRVAKPKVKREMIRTVKQGTECYYSHCPVCYTEPPGGLRFMTSNEEPGHG